MYMYMGVYVCVSMCVCMLVHLCVYACVQARVSMCVCPCDVYVPVCGCLFPSLSVLVTEARSLYWTRSSPKVTNLASQLALERCLCLLSPAITGVPAVTPLSIHAGSETQAPVLCLHDMHLVDCVINQTYFAGCLGWSLMWPAQTGLCLTGGMRMT